MARIPTRLAGPAQVTNVAATKFTVAASEKVILRHIHVQNPSGAAVTLTMSIGADAAATRILDAFSIPAAAAGVTGNVVDFFCYYVLDAAEVLQAFASTTLILTLTLDGDRIVLG
jgi:hypothetical protein